PESSMGEIGNVKGEVVFDHVAFGYGEQLLMKDLNIDVKPGQTVAIVGPTGAGKTTLINLLMRFYEVKGGSIKLDGTDIQSMSRQEMREQFSKGLQDTWLFNGSIKDNIAYRKSNASETEVIQAAKSTSANQFIRTLPDGYDNILNED